MPVKWSRILPFACALSVFILFEIAFIRPTWIFQLLAVALFISLVLVFKVVPAPKFKSKNFLKAVVPVTLISSGLGFAFFLEYTALRQVIALLIAAALMLFLEGLIAAQTQGNDLERKLENFAGYAITFTVFFSASVFFGLKVLLSLKFWIVALSFFVLVAILNYVMLWFSRAPRNKVLLFSGVLTLLTFELFLVFTFLPVYFMVSGAALTILWYTGTLISRAKMLGLLNQRMISKHLLLGGILLGLLLLTARWV